ncbi:hypothetical protein HGM15179_014610 [Zosterops borbonicus]|uniref:Uncharacterized protein n=1 Tax=Zosterops borbonicus TaxID=364589 RepID=A0A8K1G6J5_9PASS|nr:hypothetical protein HGM15179_014610 [Zosterops borbonicus]
MAILDTAGSPQPSWTLLDNHGHPGHCWVTMAILDAAGYCWTLLDCHSHTGHCWITMTMLDIPGSPRPYWTLLDTAGSPWPSWTSLDTPGSLAASEVRWEVEKGKATKFRSFPI